MIVYPGKYAGNIKIPSSKSDSQRAILAAGLAQAKSILRNVGHSSDELNMLRNIAEFGAKVKQENGVFSIEGTRSFPNQLRLNVGESGLGARLVTSILLAQKGKFEVLGEGTLRTRSMSFFGDHFKGKISLIDDDNGHLPIRLEGPFEGGKLTVNGSQSSQYISGLLMALPLISNNSELIVEKLNSKPYVQMTLDTLLKFGIKIYHEDLEHFHIVGNQKYQAADYTIEGDWSSASYWLVASALGNQISVEGLNRQSLQADRAILNAFSAANCTVQFSENKIFVDGRARKAFTFDATDCPDLFPSLAVLAALTPGKSTILGLNRLANKESNRGLTVQEEFKKLGISVLLDEEMNAMIIDGNGSVHGGSVFSHHDHRIAMSLAILGQFAESSVEINHPEAVTKSYPTFWQDLESLKK